MEHYIILAIISTIFFGVNAIILKSSKNIDSITLTLVSLITATLFTSLYWVFFNAKKQFSINGALFGIGSGLVYTLALVLFVIAIKQGKAGIVATINALSAGVAVILAVLILGEKLSLLKVAGIILGVIAVVLLAI